MTTLGFKSRQSSFRIQINATQSSSMKFRSRMFKKQNPKFLYPKRMLDHTHYSIYVSNAAMSAVFAHPVFLPPHLESSISSFLGQSHPPALPTVSVDCQSSYPILVLAMPYKPDQYRPLSLPLNLCSMTARVSLVPLF